jgi:DNA-binding Lrp family transcriptional regulator
MPVDDVDVSICRSLLDNSRVSYSELGKMLGITPQAVHRRVQVLTDLGVLKGTVTRLSFSAMGRMWVFIYGRSTCPSMNEAAKRIEKINNVIVLMIASGNQLYMQCMAKDAAELAELVSSVQSAASLQDIQVGIVTTPPPAPPGTLSALDIRLVKALQTDSRKPISRLAADVGITAKTARKRLNRLMKEGLVQFSIHWSPGTVGGLLVQLLLVIRSDAQKEKVAVEIVKGLSSNTVRTLSFSNLPNQMIATLWTNDVRDTELICHRLEETGLFISVVPNIVREARYYEDHLSSAFEELVRPSKNKPRVGSSGSTEGT